MRPHPGRHALRLDRARRRAEAVQVEQVGHGGAPGAGAPRAGLRSRRRRAPGSAPARRGQRGEQLGVHAAEAAVAHAEHVVAGAGDGDDARDQLVDRGGDDGARAERRAGPRSRPSPARRRGRTPGRLPRAPRAAAPSSSRASWCSSAARRRRGCAPCRPCGAGRRGWCASRSDGARSRRRPRRRRPRRAARAGAGRCESSPSARAATSGATPACSAAPIAASAFIWLCSPSSCHSTRAIFSPPRSTSKACGSPRARSMPGCSFLPPKRCTPLQQPIDEHALQRLVAGVDDQPAARRHGAHQVMELALDRREVVEDVGVVELEVVEDRGARPVVDELAALVEEGGVVLVGLDHERRRPGRRGAPRRRSRAARRRPGSPGACRPTRGSRRASPWCRSCRGCRRRRARGGRRARDRPATAGRWCRPRRRRGWPRAADCRG